MGSLERYLDLVFLADIAKKTVKILLTTEFLQQYSHHHQAYKPMFNRSILTQSIEFLKVMFCKDISSSKIFQLFC